MLPTARVWTGADSTAAAPKRRTASARARKLGGAVGRGDMASAKEVVGRRRWVVVAAVVGLVGVVNRWWWCVEWCDEVGV